MYVKIPKNIISRMEIVMTDCKLTLQQVIQKTGCTYAINGGLYDMKTGKPNAIPLRVAGKTVATSKDGYWMLAWNKGPDMKMIHSKDMANYQYAIACATMLKDGQNTYFTYTSAQGGKRGRTGFGDDKDNIILYCTTDTNGAQTPQQLRTNMKNIGALDAIMLDCGGSSQMYNNGIYLQAERRKVAYWICVWTTPTTSNSITPIEQNQCPFREPTINLRQGSRGEGVKWLQWHLNKFLGRKALVEDGIFGAGTKNALINFQKSVFTNPKDWDGICGVQTRKKLKENK